MNKLTVLIVDDEPLLRKSLSDWLQEGGYRVFIASNGKEGIKKMKKEKIDLAFVDLKLPEMDGIEVMHAFKKIYSEVVVIIITAFATVKSAVEAIKEGAYDYLIKPFSLKEIDFTLRKVIERRELIAENIYLKQQLKQHYGFQHIVWRSSKMKRIRDLIEVISPSSATVLIQGASGTGKEVIARTIHSRSLRSDKPFIAINCAAIPETLLESELFGYEEGTFTGANKQKIGRFEMANGGTVFLDEVGIMSLSAQVDLLRVLQEREFRRIGGTQIIPVDVRVISASNQDLKKAIVEKTFREDLYYRLNAVSIDLPLLKERKEDIPFLIEHFLKIYCTKEKKKIKSISRKALSLMVKYDWPGNIRELENVIERTVILSKGDIIMPKHLSEVIQEDTYKQTPVDLPLDDSLEAMEKAHILTILKKLNCNISKTALALKIDRGTLHNKLRKYKIKTKREMPY
ncbi:MAG: sigma-54 dependent transcriptional regulator [bacterium]|nr:sigma-54 dependent transcriptional regulator [bacterium]